jgi:hypothetical protein
MGAAKTISQGNPPSDDTMQKYMSINKKKLRVKEILRYQQENLSRKIGAFNRGESPNYNNPAENLSRKIGAFNRGESPNYNNPAENLSRKIGAFNRGESPEMRSGINLGPGRANRTPEQGSREYEQLLQQVRRRNKGRR